MSDLTSSTASLPLPGAPLSDAPVALFQSLIHFWASFCLLAILSSTLPPESQGLLSSDHKKEKTIVDQLHGESLYIP